MPAARHTPEQKAAALAAYREFGPAEASRRTGIRKGTIAAWAHRNGLQTNASETTRAATTVAKLSAEARATALAEAMLHVAETRVGWVSDQSPSKDVRHAMTVAAIAVDKAQLLTGKATSRTEVMEPEQATAEIERLQAEWRKRQKAS